MEKKKRSSGEIIRIVVMVFCAAVAVFCAAYLIRYLVLARTQTTAAQAASDQYVATVAAAIPASESSAGETAENETGTQPESEISDSSGTNGEELSELVVVDMETLQQDSSYVVGWLQVSGLDVIDYPVVQYWDNRFFLTHSWDGTYSGYGSIFMDMDCSGDFSDPYTIIYGHNMKNGSMFGSLKKYKDESFYRDNGGVVTLCLDGETRIYQIFSVHVVSPGNGEVYNTDYVYGDAYEAALQDMADQSIYDTGVAVSGNDSVITLSTCSGDNRLVVHAKLVREIFYS